MKTLKTFVGAVLAGISIGLGGLVFLAVVAVLIVKLGWDVWQENVLQAR